MRLSHTNAGHSRRTSGWVLGVACGGPALAAVVIAGLFVAGAPGFTSLQRAGSTAAMSGHTQKVDLTIVTNAGPHHDLPAFQPASFTINTGQPVEFTVTNLDSATPLPTDLKSHAMVTGVLGGHEAVVPLGAKHSSAATGLARRVTAIAIGSVSHTFSITALGINVPILGNSRTTFTILVRKPGNYTWECFDPCGSGTNGFGSPMGVPGYMMGTVNATAS
jgi:plastocyanin